MAEPKLRDDYHPAGPQVRPGVSRCPAARNKSGERVEIYYGYYTMDVIKKGNVYGMLGVNGYTGGYGTMNGTAISLG